MTYSDFLGFEVLSVENGNAHLRTTVKENHLNMHGFCHGGFTYSLADEAFALASNSHEADAVALSVRMDYFKAVKLGDVLDAIATEEHLGRSVATYRIEIKRMDTPVALFTGTVFRKQNLEKQA